MIGLGIALILLGVLMILFSFMPAERKTVNKTGMKDPESETE